MMYELLLLLYCLQELKLKGEECERLSHVRNQLEQELEELTASLFEVNTAIRIMAHVSL